MEEESAGEAEHSRLESTAALCGLGQVTFTLKASIPLSVKMRVVKIKTEDA